MKNIFAFLLCFLCFGAVSVTANERIFITNGEWPPYLSENLPFYGVASQIVEEAYQTQNVKVVWMFASWARSLELARTGVQWHASAVWWKSDKYSQDFYLSEPVVNTYNVFFHRKQEPLHWEHFSDLKGKVIGLTRGYDYGEAFENALKKLELKTYTVNTDEQNFGLLLKQRIDVFPNDPFVGRQQIKHVFGSETDQIVYHPKKFAQRTLHLLISKKAPNAEILMNKFNLGLKVMEESGRLAILEQALLDGKFDY